ncbi:MAG: hypothetical protein NC388_07010 [Clostridium sp.]|nr:hypothetical protein [Clostridium sp.]
MRRLTLWIVALALMGLSGCHRQKKNAGTEIIPDSLPTTQTSVIYGHLGEGTGMSVWELITDSGDTILLNKTDEINGTYGMILGCITNYTDSYAVETDDSLTCVKVAVNLSQLATTWTDNTLDGDTISLHTDGRTETCGTNIPSYTSWSLTGDRLLLHRTVAVSEPRMATTATDTMRILSLCTDSMQISIDETTVKTLYHPNLPK